MIGDELRRSIRDRIREVEVRGRSLDLFIVPHHRVWTKVAPATEGSVELIEAALIRPRRFVALGTLVIIPCKMPLTGHVGFVAVFA